MGTDRTDVAAVLAAGGRMLAALEPAARKLVCGMGWCLGDGGRLAIAVSVAPGGAPDALPSEWEGVPVLATSGRVRAL